MRQAKQVLIEHTGPAPPGIDAKEQATWEHNKRVAELLLGKIERSVVARIPLVSV